jgi:uncharacterized membrane protein YraQ (UPF0718 family)
MDKQRLHNSLKKTNKGILKMLPLIFGILLLVSMLNILIPKETYLKFFTGNLILDAIKGSFLGSVLTGNPITGYVLADNFLKNGVSLVAVTSFLVAWVTVGIVQLPAEMIALGKRFAISRNLTSFVFSILVAIVTVLILKML